MHIVLFSLSFLHYWNCILNFDQEYNGRRGCVAHPGVGGDGGAPDRRRRVPLALARTHASQRQGSHAHLLAAWERWFWQISTDTTASRVIICYYTTFYIKLFYNYLTIPLLCKHVISIYFNRSEEVLFEAEAEDDLDSSESITGNNARSVSATQSVERQRSDPSPSVDKFGTFLKVFSYLLLPVHITSSLSFTTTSYYFEFYIYEYCMLQPGNDPELLPPRVVLHRQVYHVVDIYVPRYQLSPVYLIHQDFRTGKIPQLVVRPTQNSKL